MDIKKWDEVVILEDANGWQGLHCICDMVERGMAFLLSIKFPGVCYIVKDDNRNRVEIVK